MEEMKNQDLGSEVTETKTYSEEEVAKLIQSETDKRVTQALKTQQAKFEKQMSEAEKLRGMDEAAQEKYKLEQKIEELEEMNKKYALAENKATLSKALADRNLPVSFVDYLVAEDADTMLANVDAFDRAFKSAVNDAVSIQLARGGKPSNNATSQTGINKDSFEKMSLAQRAELYKTNPTLYKELAK